MKKNRLISAALSLTMAVFAASPVIPEMIASPEFTAAAAESSVTITSQPEDVHITAAKNVTFSVAAATSAASLSYQWEYSKDGGKSWIRVTKNGTSASYTTSGSQSRNGWLFRCAVTGGNDTVRSDSAAIIFGEENVLKITSQPQDVTISASGNVTFSVGAQGDNLSYQWEYSKDGGKNWIRVTKNGTSASYTTSGSKSRNGWLFRCAVTGGNDTIRSESAAIIFKEAAVLKITSQPQDVTISSSQNVTFKVGAEGNNLSYQWEYSKDGGKNWIRVTKNGTSASYTTSGSQSRNGWLFRCAVSDGNNSATSDAAKIIFKEAELAVISNDISLSPDQTYQLESGYKYISSDKKIADVSSKGIVTAKAEGNCKIFVYDTSGNVNYYNVYVKADSTPLTLNSTDISLTVFDQFHLEANKDFDLAIADESIVNANISTVGSAYSIEPINDGKTEMIAYTETGEAVVVNVEVAEDYIDLADGDTFSGSVKESSSTIYKIVNDSDISKDVCISFDSTGIMEAVIYHNDLYNYELMDVDNSNPLYCECAPGETTFIRFKNGSGEPSVEYTLYAQISDHQAIPKDMVYPKGLIFNRSESYASSPEEGDILPSFYPLTSPLIVGLEDYTVPNYTIRNMFESYSDQIFINGNLTTNHEPHFYVSSKDFEATILGDLNIENNMHFFIDYDISDEQPIEYKDIPYLYVDGQISGNGRGITLNNPNHLPFNIFAGNISNPEYPTNGFELYGDLCMMNERTEINDTPNILNGYDIHILKSDYQIMHSDGTYTSGGNVYCNGDLTLNVHNMVIDGDLCVKGDLILNGSSNIRVGGRIICGGTIINNNTYGDSLEAIGGIYTGPSFEYPSDIYSIYPDYLKREAIYGHYEADGSFRPAPEETKIVTTLQEIRENNGLLEDGSMVDYIYPDEQQINEILNIKDRITVNQDGSVQEPNVAYDGSYNINFDQMLYFTGSYLLRDSIINIKPTSSEAFIVFDNAAFNSTAKIVIDDSMAKVNIIFIGDTRFDNGFIGSERIYNSFGTGAIDQDSPLNIFFYSMPDATIKFQNDVTICGHSLAPSLDINFSVRGYRDLEYHTQNGELIEERPTFIGSGIFRSFNVMNDCPYYYVKFPVSPAPANVY